MAQVKVNIQRLTAIRKRQAVDQWGKDYVAAIFATPKEAPGISRPSILVPEKLGGRDMHLLSHPEKAAGLLACIFHAVEPIFLLDIWNPLPLLVVSLLN